MKLVLIIAHVVVALVGKVLLLLEILVGFVVAVVVVVHKEKKVGVP